MSVRVIPGEIDAKDATTRAAIPSASQPRWPPFKRVAETIATPRRRFPPHKHEGVEVVTFVIEGSGTYEFGATPPYPLQTGSCFLLTAPTAVAHAINPGKGQTIRWFSVVAGLREGKVTEPRLQSSQGLPEPQPDGTTVRHLVGPGSQLQSAIDLDAQAVRFDSEGTTFRKVGHGSLAVCYALAGRGRVDNDPLEGGEAALVEDSAGIAIQGQPGFQVILLRTPRPAQSSVTGERVKGV
jgi:quercetin 2,3-dioxygenase